MGRLSSFERALCISGIALVSIWAGVRGWGSWSARRSIARFESALPVATAAPSPGGVDMALWSDSRVRHFHQSFDRDAGPAIGVLRIAKIGLEVPILEGTEELTLDRGVGHIEGTDLPGGRGNVGIAGHRDGFFRGLKDIGAGDVVELRTSSEVLTYVVADVRIVDPDAVWVLGSTGAPSITLVTCYPFYFVGSAPQRYVVRAIRR